MTGVLGTQAPTRPPRPRLGGGPGGRGRYSGLQLAFVYLLVCLLVCLFPSLGSSGGRARGPPRPGPYQASAVARPDCQGPPRPGARPRSSGPTGPPHLDFPTPLSPMMRILRVVNTSSSILTPLRSARRRPAGRPAVACLPRPLTPDSATRACAARRRRRCHLLPTPDLFGLREAGPPHFRPEEALRLRTTESHTSFRKSGPTVRKRRWESSEFYLVPPPPASGSSFPILS